MIQQLSFKMGIISKNIKAHGKKQKKCLIDSISYLYFQQPSQSLVNMEYYVFLRVILVE